MKLNLSILGLVAGVAATSIASPVYSQASSPVVGGDPLSFSNAQIFVDGFEPAVVYRGFNPDNANNLSLLVQVQQNNLTLNGLYRTQLLPQIFHQGAVPAIGDLGRTSGLMTFRGFGSSGEQILGLNVPVDLQFRVSGINATATGTIDEYTSEIFLLNQTVIVNNGVISRSIPVVSVSYGEPLPSNIPLAKVESGTSYDAPFTANIIGGEIPIPQTGLFDTNTATLPEIDNDSLASAFQGLDRIQTPRSTDTISPRSTDVASPIPVNAIPTAPVAPSGSIGITQRTPVMPTRTVRRGVFVFIQVISGVWYDPPLADSYEFTMTPSPQPVGLRGRVFPGMQAREMRDESVFTAITGLPEGIDADNRFTVTVGDLVLGEFSPADEVHFADYADQLGDLLVEGEGVKNFTISGIEPGVDPDNPLAFPVRLEFNTPTASFEMAAQGDELEENASASIYSDTMMNNLQRNQDRLAAVRQTITAEVLGEADVAQDQSPAETGDTVSLQPQHNVEVSQMTVVD